MSPNNTRSASRSIDFNGREEHYKYTGPWTARTFSIDAWHTYVHKGSAPSSHSPVVHTLRHPDKRRSRPKDWERRGLFHDPRDPRPSVPAPLRGRWSRICGKFKAKSPGVRVRNSLRFNSASLTVHCSPAWCEKQPDYSLSVLATWLRIYRYLLLRPSGVVALSTTLLSQIALSYEDIL